jgi:hypothetical protein
LQLWLHFPPPRLVEHASYKHSSLALLSDISTLLLDTKNIMPVDARFITQVNNKTVFLKQDSFYYGLSEEALVHVHDYNFDHPGTMLAFVVIYVLVATCKRCALISLLLHLS